MKSNIKKMITTLVIFTSFTSYAEMIPDNTLFYKDKKVNNKFLDPYVFPGDSNYFQNFFALDSVYSDQLGCFYGIGTDKEVNVGYYFDVNRKSKYLGIMKTQEKEPLN